MGGKAWTFGDHINTESVLDSEFLYTQSGKEEDRIQAKKHVLERVDPEFAIGVKEGDFVVAGRNFGTGSGRPAGEVLKAVGISAIICESASYVFYRSTWAVGLPVLICPGIQKRVSKGDIIEVDIWKGIIENKTTGESFMADPTPPTLLEIYKCGNLMDWIISRKDQYPNISSEQ